MASSRLVARRARRAATRCSRPANHGASSISYDARPRHGHDPGAAVASRRLLVAEHHDALVHLGSRIAQAHAGLASDTHRGGEALGRRLPGESSGDIVDPAGPGRSGREHVRGDGIGVARGHVAADHAAYLGLGQRRELDDGGGLGVRAAGSGEVQQHGAVRTRSGPLHHQEPRLVMRPVVGRGDGAAVTRDLLRQGGREPGRTGTGRTAEDDGGGGTGERALPGVAQRLQLSRHDRPAECRREAPAGS